MTTLQFCSCYPFLLKVKEVKGYKYNIFLESNKTFVKRLKTHLSSIVNSFNEEDISDDQLRWRYSKLEIKSFTIRFSKAYTKKRKKEREFSENEIKHWGQNAENIINNNDCFACKPMIL